MESFNIQHCLYNILLLDVDITEKYSLKVRFLVISYSIGIVQHLLKALELLYEI